MASRTLFANDDDGDDGDGDDDVILQVKTKTIHETIHDRTQQAEQEGRTIHIDHVDDDGGGGSISDVPPLNPYDFIGRRIYKDFGDVNGGWYFGEVTEIHELVDNHDKDDKNVYYHVLYDDDDREDFYWNELKPWLQEWELNRSKDVVWKKKKEADVQNNQQSGSKRKTAPSTASSTLLSTPIRVKKEKTSSSSSSTAVTPSPAPPRAPPAKFNAQEWIDHHGRRNIAPTWVTDMASWLENSQNLSKQNGRQILRQVQKLVCGQGVDYKNWPPWVVFLEGVHVTLDYDFEELRQLAVSYQKKFGEDKGHGWLLTHPIKKLQLFQQEQGITPTIQATSQPGFVSHIL